MVNLNITNLAQNARRLSNIDEHQPRSLQTLQGENAKINFNGGLEGKLSAKEARYILDNIRSQLTAGGTIQSGYLSLQKDSAGSFSLVNQSRLTGTRDSKENAATLIKNLISVAYKGALEPAAFQQLEDSIGHYLNSKNFGPKLGTVSFVKLINHLELNTNGQAIFDQVASKGSLSLHEQQKSEIPADDLKSRVDRLAVGDSIRSESTFDAGLKGSAKASAGFNQVTGSVGVDGQIHTRNVLKKTEGGFVVHQMKFKGGGVSAGGSHKAVLDMHSANLGAKIGRVKETELKFATAEAAIRFIEGGKKALRENEYEISMSHKSMAIRKSSATSNITAQRALASKPVGGTAEQGLMQHNAHAEGTVFKRANGDEVSHRVYQDNHQKSNFFLKIVCAGLKKIGIEASASKTTSNIRLDLMEISKSTEGAGLTSQQFVPDMRVSIDSTLVAACRDEGAVIELADIQSNRMLAVMKKSNEDSPPGSFDLSDEGKASLRASMLGAFQHVHNQFNALVDPAQRMGAPQQRQILQDGQIKNASLGVNLGVIGVGAKASYAASGGQNLTFRIKFEGDIAGGEKSRANGKVDIATTTAAMKKFGLSAGIGLPDWVPAKISASASASYTSLRSDLNVTQQIDTNLRV